MKAIRSKNKLGQNTAEYMLLLLLIGGGSIMAFKVFGRGIINRFASVTSIVTGGTASNTTALKEEIKKAEDAKVDFKTFEHDTAAPSSGD